MATRVLSRVLSLIIGCSNQVFQNGFFPQGIRSMTKWHLLNPKWPPWGSKITDRVWAGVSYWAFQSTLTKQVFDLKERRPKIASSDLHLLLSPSWAGLSNIVITKLPKILEIFTHIQTTDGKDNYRAGMPLLKNIHFYTQKSVNHVCMYLT